MRYPCGRLAHLGVSLFAGNPDLKNYQSDNLLHLELV